MVRQRRFFFDNYFHRILHRPTGDPVRPTPEETRRGYVVFTRDTMQDVFYNDTPLRQEIDAPVQGFGFAGQMEPLTSGDLPLGGPGHGRRTSVGDLTGPATIPAGRISVGYVSNRISRVSMDGIGLHDQPRYVMPARLDRRAQGRHAAVLAHRPRAGRRPAGHLSRPDPPGSPTRPAGQRAGRLSRLPRQARPGGHSRRALDHRIHLPWFGDDPATQAWNRDMERRSMEKLREYGFTTFTGLPIVRYLGFKDGKPQFDFSEGDRQMALARECGFTMPVVTYCETRA